MVQRQGAIPAAESAHLFDYIRVILKRLWLIVGIFVLVVGVVGVATYRATPMYRATAILDIRQPTVLPGGLDPTEFLRGYSNSQVYMNTQYALLRSRRIVETMVERRDLAGWDAFKGQSTRQIARSITGNIEVVPQRDTTLVAVTVVDPRKHIVHRIVNALVETFIEEQAKAQQTSMQDTIDRLETKWLEYAGKAELGNNQINRLFEENNTDRETFMEKLEFARQRIQQKQSMIDGEVLDLARKRPFYDQIAAAMAEDDPQGEALKKLYQNPLVARDSSVMVIADSIRQLDRNIKVLVGEGGLGPKEPSVLALQRQRADQLARLQHQQREVLLAYYRNYELTQDTKIILERQLEEDEREFKSLSRIKLKFDESMVRIERDKAESDRYNQLYEKLFSRSSDNLTPVKIEEQAEQPFAPFRPDKQMNMILGAIFGLLAGIGMAFFLEYMDDTIKTKEELQRITDAPLLGVIPNISAKRGDVAKKDLFAYNQPKSTISEAFRGVRTAISYSSEGKEARTFIVTSSGPKEGKTTIGINISTVMAYSGARTLLIDADLRKPRVHKSFELNNSRGLTNLIIGDASAEDLIQSTGLERLDVLSSGPIPPNPSELLGGTRMIEILEELQEKYDRILIDTPPIGAVTDAAVVGRIVDFVLLVVHAGKTRKKLIERGLEQLSQINVPVNGIILNNLRIGQKRYYPGYYHYYYSYSSYYGTDSPQKSRARDKTRA